jgi:hypothetical protein
MSMALACLPPCFSPLFNPDHALGFTGIGLPVENTLISLRRPHSLAFGFETFAFWQKAELSRRSTVFQGNPIPVLTKYLGSDFPLAMEPGLKENRFTGDSICQMT